MSVRIKTQGDWLRDLEANSAKIAALNLTSKIHANVQLDTTASNLANSREHTKLITRGVENLLTHGSQPQAATEDLLLDIVRRDRNGGKFSELVALDWLSQRRLRFRGQISLTPTEILGQKDAVIDGCFTHSELYFDIKAFGFNGWLAKRLKERLTELLPGLSVFVEGSWDVATDDFEDLITRAGAIAQELQTKSTYASGALRIRVAQPKPVSVETRVMSPYALARENAKFPYTSANQFTRNAPFLLIYVVHPWFGSTIHHDFAEAGTCFTRSFARRAFMQFSNCADPVQPVCSKVGAGLTFAEASKCLSGMLFINAWPADLYPPNTSDARHASSWLYLNPRATHKIFEVDAELLAQPRTQVLLDNFADDDY